MSTQTTTARENLSYTQTIGMIAAGGRYQAGRGFLSPYTLATSSDGRIFVVNRGASRVCICDLDENFIGAFADGPGAGDGQLNQPTDSAFDSRDRLYITDEALHRITIFDTEGTFLGKWGEQGDAPGQINGPSGIDTGQTFWRRHVGPWEEARGNIIVVVRRLQPWVGLLAYLRCHLVGRCFNRQ